MTPVADPFMSGQRPRYIGPELRGPADADGFRVKVGRYGDRFYMDPLPGDHIAPASDWIGPAVSIVKKASGNDWTFTALKRVADALDTDKYRNLAKWPYADRYEALKAINKIGLNAAGQRGTNIHLMFEAFLHGQPCPISEGMPGYEYRGAVEQFFAQYNPTLVAAEFVCIHHTLNGVGYGGTGDAIIELDGLMSQRMRCLVDWKSRGVDSEHGAYPEEAAQVGALAGADYIIVEGHDGPERRLMPTLDGGLIVSIKPDGCRIYPIDLDKGFAHWTTLHAWWVARRDEREAIGRQWPARKIVEGEGQATVGLVNSASPSTPVSPPASMSAAVNAGVVGSSADQPPHPPATIGEQGFWTPTAEQHNNSPITNSESITLSALAWVSQPAPTPLAPLPDHPDEGKPATTRRAESLFELLAAEYTMLQPASREWITRLVSEAMQANRSFHSQGGHRTERRYYIIRGLVNLADTPDDEILRALVTAALDNDAPLDPRHTPGHCVGSLDAAAAQRFAALVDDYVAVTA